MREQPTVNATWKFAEPCGNFQNSESFWTSLFALLLLASGRPQVLEFPLNDPLPQDPWFEPRPDPWRVPTLSSNAVVVEGKSGLAEFASKCSGRQFQEARFQGIPALHSDIAVWDGDALILLEVKTIRAALSSDQVSRYLRWAKALSNEGCPTRAKFLLSSGHENGGDHRWLLEASTEPEFGGVLLWEDVFRVANKLAAEGTPLPSLLKTAGLLDLATEYH